MGRGRNGASECEAEKHLCDRELDNSPPSLANVTQSVRSVHLKSF